MTSPFDKLKLDPKLACELLAVFARFEYALKTSGFAIGDENGVSPGWDDFARTVDDGFNPAATERLQAAVTYLLGHPPKKQILRDGQIEWREAPPDANLPRAQKVLLMVRRVRNNLFHGGKFLAAEREHDDRRDRLLVEHSLAVLLSCVPLNDRVRMSYES